jgi:adenylate cyclase
MIAGTVYDLVHRKLSIGFEFAGRQSVKNMEEPVPAYRLLLDGTAPPGPAASVDTPAPTPSEPGPALPVWQRRAVRFPVAMIVFFFLVNLFSGLHEIWFQWPSLPFLMMLIWGLFGPPSRPDHETRAAREQRRGH